jgi:hypothetical protein
MAPRRLAVALHLRYPRGVSRPRLVVPGTLELSPTFVRAEHEILLGDLAGYLPAEDVTNWKGSYTFGALEDLSFEHRCHFAPHFAGEWAAIAGDAAPQGYRDGVEVRRPHVERLLRRARLLLLDDPWAQEHLDPGSTRVVGRVVQVGFTRNADDFFQLELMQGGVARASVSGALSSIEESLDPRPPTRIGSGRLIDRVLRAATSGLVDSYQISLALWIAHIADVDGWEAHLAGLAARAAPHAALASDIKRLLDDAPADADTLALPVYGEATRTRLPACTLRAAPRGDDLGAAVDVNGSPELALPAESVWTVPEVDQDSVPIPSPRIFRAVTPRRRRHGLRRRRDAVGALVLLALLVAVLIVLGRRAHP